MDLVPAGNGGAVIAVAAVTFLVLLAAFTGLMISIACRYHARKPAYAAKARNPWSLAAGPAAAPRGPAPGRPSRQPLTRKNRWPLTRKKEPQ